VTAIPKPQKPAQDSDRLDFVKKMACLIREYGVGDDWSPHRVPCTTVYAAALGFVNRQPCEAHHIRRGASSGVGTKPDASWTVPLCSAGHHEYHHIGHDSFEKKYGLNLEEHRKRINQEFAKVHPAPKLKVKRVHLARLALGVTHCPLCRQNHSIAWKKIDVRPRCVRFWCIKSRQYAEVPR
jgi:hypothetical protein